MQILFQEAAVKLSQNCSSVEQGQGYDPVVTYFLLRSNRSGLKYLGICYLLVFAEMRASLHI